MKKIRIDFGGPPPDGSIWIVRVGSGASRKQYESSDDHVEFSLPDGEQISLSISDKRVFFGNTGRSEAWFQNATAGAPEIAPAAPTPVPPVVLRAPRPAVGRAQVEALQRTESASDSAASARDRQEREARERKQWSERQRGTDHAS